MRIFYPQSDLEKVVLYLQRNKEQVLNAPRNGISRMQVLPILGFSPKSGAGQSIIASLALYGFLSKDDERGGNYRFTPLAYSVLDDDGDGKRFKQAISDALINPPLFRELDKLGDNPAGHRVEAVMVRYNVPLPKVRSAHDIYRKSLLYRQRLLSTEYIPQDTISGNKLSSKIDIDNSLGSMVIDFGNNLMIEVPKKVMLDAVANWHKAELKKIQEQL